VLGSGLPNPMCGGFAHPDGRVMCLMGWAFLPSRMVVWVGASCLGLGVRFGW